MKSVQNYTKKFYTDECPIWKIENYNKLNYKYVMSIWYINNILVNKHFILPDLVKTKKEIHLNDL